MHSDRATSFFGLVAGFPTRVTPRCKGGAIGFFHGNGEMRIVANLLGFAKPAP